MKVLTTFTCPICQEKRPRPKPYTKGQTNLCDDCKRREAMLDEGLDGPDYENLIAESETMHIRLVNFEGWCGSTTGDTTNDLHLVTCEACLEKYRQIATPRRR